jgi:hypothetical protein
MKKPRQMLNLSGALIIAIFGGYWFYIFRGAETRVKQFCAEIIPAMPVSDLEKFSVEHGLKLLRKESETSYLVESKSFGRWGCKVTIENGVVKNSEYIFND